MRESEFSRSFSPQCYTSLKPNTNVGINGAQKNNVHPPQFLTRVFANSFYSFNSIAVSDLNVVNLSLATSYRSYGINLVCSSTDFDSPFLNHTFNLKDNTENCYRNDHTFHHFVCNGNVPRAIVCSHFFRY